MRVHRRRQVLGHRPGPTITDNWVHHNAGPGLWADNNNTGFTIAGNLVEHNDSEGLVYETSYNAAVVGNTFVGNGTVKGPRNPGFPTPAIYVSESGADPRAGDGCTARLLIADNRFIDNWGGVVVWENADRYAGSPANPTQDTTLVNPDVATFDACADPDLIGDAALLRRLPLEVPARPRARQPVRARPRRARATSCTAENICGVSGVFSNFGTFPPHSPFQGTIVEQRGDPRAGQPLVGQHLPRPLALHGHGGRQLRDSWNQWRSEPYHQDAGSSTQ